MARYCGDRNSQSLVAAGAYWKSNALLRDGSVLTEKSLWTLDNLALLVRHFIDNPDASSDSFLEKFERQLKPADPIAKQLAAELQWLVWLAPSNLKQATKIGEVLEIWSWSGEPAPTSEWLDPTRLEGVGSAGQGILNYRWREFVFAIRVAHGLKTLPLHERELIVSDPWRLADWLQRVPEGDQRQFRHMFLFMLFPDEFERIFSRADREEILVKIGGKRKSVVRALTAVQIDRELLTIRKEQEKQYSGVSLDFYNPPLDALWREEERKVWLLTWNPENFDWDSLPDDRQTTHAGGSVTLRWTCANSAAKPGDLAYLVRTGRDPRGIVAVGNVIRAPYEDTHYDAERAKAGDKRQYIEVEFTRIQDPTRGDSFVQADALKGIKFQQQWAPQSSGIEINRNAAAELARLWSDCLSGASSGKTIAEAGIEYEKSEAASSPKNVVYYGPPGTGKTYAIARLREEYTAETGEQRFEFVTFHQTYGYEDFVEGIRPLTDKSNGAIRYEVVPGVFRRICGRAVDDPQHRFALFIDEINRGNTAKILGELITLVELDKRITRDADGAHKGGIEVTLPYSGDRFGVPANLDIYGTMNTADRSIALLDTALRRRFSFVELMPDPGFIAGADGKGKIDDGLGDSIDLRRLLAAINRRVVFLLNRDMQIGHAYFMTVKTFDALKHVMLNQVVPLLQEYFYEDWRRIQLVLADIGESDEANIPQIVIHEFLRPEEVFGIEGSDFEQARSFRVCPNAELTPESFRKIYESGN